MSVARAWLAAGLGVAALALTACDDDDASGTPKSHLTISAASSLKPAFTDYGERFEGATSRFSFAGSDQLAVQIRQGVEPDLYAAADIRLPDALFREGRLERPVVFAANRLVLAVPAGSRIQGLENLTRSGVELAVGAEDVPVGSYTRELLRRLPDERSRAILANVRSNEPDVAGVVGKLSRGAADAGFVYITDVKAARGRLRAIELPRRLRPPVSYGIAVVKGAERPRAARAFIVGLLAGAGRDALRSAGFEPPPGR